MRRAYHRRDGSPAPAKQPWWTREAPGRSGFTRTASPWFLAGGTGRSRMSSIRSRSDTPANTRGGSVIKRTASVLVVSALAAVFAAGASPAAPKTASLQINHFVRGCHNWSLNGGPYHVNQVMSLGRGGSLLVTNNDLMVQDLVKTSGPAVLMQLVRQSHMGAMHMTMPMNGKATPYAISHTGAQLKVTFSKAGSYHFKLIDRGDYVNNIKTVGPDNKPTLTVTVS